MKLNPEEAGVTLAEKVEASQGVLLPPPSIVGST